MALKGLNLLGPSYAHNKHMIVKTGISSYKLVCYTKNSDQAPVSICSEKATLATSFWKKQKIPWFFLKSAATAQAVLLPDNHNTTFKSHPGQTGPFDLWIGIKIT